MANLKVATWDMNGLIRHKYDMQNEYRNIYILLESGAHLKPNHSTMLKNYSIYSTSHPDGTAHAGTAIVIKKHIKHEIFPEYITEPIQATTEMVQDKQGSLMLSTVYCPPRLTSKEEAFTKFFETLGHRFICGGDWNHKNVHWGSRITLPRSRKMKKSLIKTNYTF